MPPNARSSTTHAVTPSLSGLGSRLRRVASRRLRSLATWLAPTGPAPAPPPHQRFVEAGTIHPSVCLNDAGWTLHPGAQVLIGENSLCYARLVFHRPAIFRMGARSSLGGRSEVHVSKEVSIGDDVLISWQCTLIDTDLHSLRFADRAEDILMIGKRDGRSLERRDWSVIPSRRIVIKDKAWIGLRCIILKGVTIGEGSLVGAGSVVARDVPPWTLAAGNPAQVVREMTFEERDARRAAGEHTATHGVVSGTGAFGARE